MSGERHHPQDGGNLPSVGPVVLQEIISAVSDISVIIDAKGIVKRVFLGANADGFDHAKAWESSPIYEFLTIESVPKLEARLRSLSENRQVKPIELNHTSDGIQDFPVRYTLHRIEETGDVMMLGRDLRPISETQQQLVRAQMILEQDYERHRESDIRLRVLMQKVSEAVLFVSLSDGRIIDINESAAKLLGASMDSLRGLLLTQVFVSLGRGEILSDLTNAAAAETQTEIEHLVRRSDRKLSVAPTLFRAASEQVLLLRLHPTDGIAPAPDDLSATLLALYQQGEDAIAITDTDGVIRTVNKAFLEFTNAAGVSALRGRPLADFLARGSVDGKVLIDNALRKGQMRMYATEIEDIFGNRTAVDVSATFLNEKTRPDLVFTIRQARREMSITEFSPQPASPMAHDSVRSVVELVGSATLKDIVNETTEVVEKICIETATELTNNNRVATAEMLGLSRQSLYVKLRRYNLLRKDTD